jgi:hypothetical protein
MLYPIENSLIRMVITGPYEAHRIMLYRGVSCHCIEVSQGLGPHGGYGNIKVVFPFTAKMRRHIITFKWGGEERLQAIAFGVCLHDVEKTGDNLMIRFSMEELANPDSVDQVIELINKVASALN